MKELREQLRQLAGKIPCELCTIKGGHNIEEDGGCRHRPIVSGAEVSERIAFIMKGIHFDIPIKRERRFENDYQMSLAFLKLPYRRQQYLLLGLGCDPNAFAGTEPQRYAACFAQLRKEGRVIELENAIYQQVQEQLHYEATNG